MINAMTNTTQSLTQSSTHQHNHQLNTSTQSSILTFFLQIFFQTEILFSSKVSKKDDTSPKFTRKSRACLENSPVLVSKNRLELQCLLLRKNVKCPPGRVLNYCVRTNKRTAFQSNDGFPEILGDFSRNAFP